MTRALAQRRNRGARLDVRRPLPPADPKEPEAAVDSATPALDLNHCTCRLDTQTRGSSCTAPLRTRHNGRNASWRVVFHAQCSRHAAATKPAAPPACSASSTDSAHRRPARHEQGSTLSRARQCHQQVTGPLPASMTTRGVPVCTVSAPRTIFSTSCASS